MENCRLSVRSYFLGVLRNIINIRIIKIAINLLPEHESQNYSSFQVNKLYLLLTSASVNPSEILAAKSILYEQLHSLTQRFNNLAGDDNCDYEEANVKFADAATNLKYTSLLKNVDELVSNLTKKDLDTMFNIIFIFLIK